jgi:5-methylcytosine-specific restriction endonuclease McrA
MPYRPKKPQPKQTGQYSKGRVGNFYSSAAWIKVRNLRLELTPLCVECVKIDRIEATRPSKKVVDHKKAISDGGHPLDIENTQTLCVAHHAIKTGKETAKRTRK